MGVVAESSAPLAKRWENAEIGKYFPVLSDVALPPVCVFVHAPAVLFRGQFLQNAPAFIICWRELSCQCTNSRIDTVEAREIAGMSQVNVGAVNGFKKCYMVQKLFPMP